jgi:hypothetical protein
VAITTIGVGDCGLGPVSFWQCHHRTILSADPWPDHVPVPAFGSRLHRKSATRMTMPLRVNVNLYIALTLYGTRTLKRAQVRQNCRISLGCRRKGAAVGALAALVATARPRTARNPTRSSRAIMCGQINNLGSGPTSRSSSASASTMSSRRSEFAGRPPAGHSSNMGFQLVQIRTIFRRVQGSAGLLISPAHWAKLDDRAQSR